MKKSLIIIFALVVSVMATPSTFIWVPATDVQGFLNLHFGWDAYGNLQGDGLTTDGYLTIGSCRLKKYKPRLESIIGTLTGTSLVPKS
jgi:hypothetical protein